LAGEDEDVAFGQVRTEIGYIVIGSQVPISV
jgi:hypothetical protein